MDAMKLSAALALSALMATSIAARAGSTSRRVDDFSWTDRGQALALHSESTGASADHVVVTRAEPAGFHGLRTGDVILALDGVPLHQVEALMRALRGRTSPVRLRIRRGDAESTLVWSRADYRVVAPPPPPAPPRAPRAPSPPPAPHF
jgi:S1-C subfamily serine protease